MRFLKSHHVIRLLAIPVIILVIVLFSGFRAAQPDKAETAHIIAELARSIGLSEDHPIITECQKIWWENYENRDSDWYTDGDVDALAAVVYHEAGYGCTDRHQELVAAVVLNRVRHSDFPDTITGVITQKGQYFGADLSYEGQYMRSAMQADVWEHCKSIAVKALRGEVDCPSDVVFQANFPQGNGIYEYGYTSYSVTYFCYK